jgi:hypothetical protein
MDGAPLTYLFRIGYGGARPLGAKPGRPDL